MILLMFLVMIASSHSSEMLEILTPVCETKGKAVLRIDLTVQQINTAQDKSPISLGKNTSLPMDCEDVLKSGNNVSGVYEVWPRNRIMDGPLNVYCDMNTDGGGWTVIQRRGNYSQPKDYFFKNWESYKKGFGNIKEDFWLGNDNIFALSNQKAYSIRFDLQDFEGNKRFALYDTFWIEDENRNYTIHITGYSGDAGDSIGKAHNGQQFSTQDKDNDDFSGNCADKYKGAWWYENCHNSNLNGLYHGGKHDSKGDGVNWHHWKGSQESLQTTEMKIRKKENFI